MLQEVDECILFLTGRCFWNQDIFSCVMLKTVCNRKTFKRLIVDGFISSERYFMHHVPKLGKTAKQETFLRHRHCHGVWVGLRVMIYGGIIRLAGSKIFIFQCPEVPAFRTVLGKLLTLLAPTFPPRTFTRSGSASASDKQLGGFSFMLKLARALLPFHSMLMLYLK